MSVDTIGAYEQNRYLPPPDSAVTLADALGLSGGERDAFMALAAGLGAGDVTAPTRPPSPRAALVGRAADLDAVARLLAGPARLVTVTGPPGVGKSALALAAAERSDGDFPDGIGFADLAPLRDPALVAPAVARAVGLVEQGTAPLAAQLATHLGDRRLLLLLDNVDAVAESAPLLADLAAAAAGLRVLATSREMLRVAGEVWYRVEPLEGPPALELLVARARAIDPSFDPEEDQATLAKICTRLEGLPLALELAAARLRFLSPPAVLAGLESRLRFLAHGPRDLPPRQRALRAALDWSHDLLTPDERLVFRRLAVFAGGCTVEAATAVCDVAPELPAPATAVPIVLEALVDKSLVRAVGARDDLRFTMLDTLHEYADEWQAEHGEVVQALAAHADYYLRLGMRSAGPTGHPDAAALDLLEREVDNLRAAAAWFMLTGQADAAIAIALILFPYWHSRGHFTEGRGWLLPLLRLPEGNPLLRSAIMNKATALAILQGDLGEGAALATEALAMARGTGSPGLIAEAAQSLGYLARFTGDAATELLMMEEHLANRLAAGGEEGNPAAGLALAIARLNVGHAMRRRGDHAAARGRYEEVLADGRADGDDRAVALALAELGELAAIEGDLPRARALVEEWLAIERRDREAYPLARATGLLGEILLRASDPARARPLLEEALARYRVMSHEEQAATVDALLAALDAEDNDRATVHGEP